jgi:protein-S-isoprenylcysteine O-methyltransferase Ste14
MTYHNYEIQKAAVALMGTLLTGLSLKQHASLPSKRAGDKPQDKYWKHWFVYFNLAFFLGFIWNLIWFCTSNASPIHTPWTSLEILAAVGALGGSSLRLWAMQTLGRFFTFEVTIRERHTLVEAGPYRWLMHPSYTGLIFSIPGLLFLLGGPGLIFRWWLYWLGISPMLLSALSKLKYI